MVHSIIHSLIIPKKYFSTLIILNLIFQLEKQILLSFQEHKKKKGGKRKKFFNHLIRAKSCHDQKNYCTPFSFIPYISAHVVQLHNLTLAHSKKRSEHFISCVVSVLSYT